MKRSQKVRQEKPIPQPKYQFSIPSIKPITSNQSLFMDALRTKQLVIADGSSGTGKTYLACYWAAKNLIERNIKKIVLLRCYQPLAGRTIGFVPGDATEKLMPYYKQMVDYLEEFLGKVKTEIYLKNNEIEICSLENIRGRSWDNAIVIVDESQGLFIPEVQALVTRIGDGSQMILVGDASGFQSDFHGSMNGLTYLQKLTLKYHIEDCATVTFTSDDIVRSGIVKEFVKAFESEVTEEQIGFEIIKQKEIFSQIKKGR